MFKRHTSKQENGFTLIEIMIVVAMVAILSAIAYPAYTDYLDRAKIPAALAELSNARVAMEQFFMDNRSYAPTNAAGGTPTNACTAAGLPKTIKEGFTIQCNPAPTATTYTIEAVGSDRLKGLTYTVNQANVKATNIISPADSKWKAHSPNDCWVVKQTGTCG